MSTQRFKELLFLMNHIETDAEHYAKFHCEVTVAYDRARAAEERLTKALRLFTGNPYVGGYCIACGGPKSLDDHADNCRYGIARRAIEAAEGGKKP